MPPIHPRPRGYHFASFLAACLVLLVNVSATLPPTLSNRIDQLLTSGKLGNTLWGIDIRDVETGERIYGYNADHLLMPASTSKLLTSATALDALGSDFRYQTTLYYDGEVTGKSTLEGDLFIVGSGDPTFASEAMLPREDPLRKWARRLAKLGITRIEGRIIGIDDTFSDNPYAEGWDITYVTDQAGSWMGLSTSGLAYNDNTLNVRIRARAVGQKPALSITPSSYLNIHNNAVTRGYATLQFDRRLNNLASETYVLEGSLPRSYDGTFIKPMHNPTLFAAYTFREHLREAGITADAAVYDADVLDEKPEVEEAKPLFAHFSRPLVDILELMNHESNNLYAEQIFRTFSPDGTLEGSSHRVKALLRRAGVEEAEDLSIRDGSGLSRKTMISASAMTRMLAHMRSSHPESEAYRSTIAMGGEPESTLRYRMRGLPVRAKTGTLFSVRALSGYAQTGSGRTIAFAFFANNLPVEGYLVTHTFDRLIMMLTSLPT